LLLPLLDEIFFVLRKRMSSRTHIVRQTDFDIVVYALADAAGQIMINDAGHGERREMAGRREGGTRAKRKMSGREEIYHGRQELCMYKREIISDHNSQGSLVQLCGSRHPFPHSSSASSLPKF
jgi:hypothetical protein